MTLPTLTEFVSVFAGADFHEVIFVAISNAKTCLSCRIWF